MQSIRIYSFAIACCLVFCLSPIEHSVAQTEFVVKDTMSDFDLWVGGTMSPFQDADLLLSSSPNRDDEKRLYVTFSPAESGTLLTLSLPVGYFDPPGIPVNNPSSNPNCLSVKLFESLSDAESEPDAIDGIVSAPSNDWQDDFLTIVGGYELWLQEWSLEQFSYQVNAGQTYLLSIAAVTPHVDVDQQPLLPLVTGNGNLIGSQPDHFLIEGGFGDLPTPLSTFYSEEQAAARLTAISMDVLLGDINCDGAVNLLDVAPFVELISSGEFSPKGDFDSNGAVNLLDVAPFVNAIAGG